MNAARRCIRYTTISVFTSTSITRPALRRPTFNECVSPFSDHGHRDDEHIVRGGGANQPLGLCDAPRFRRLLPS